MENSPWRATPPAFVANEVDVNVPARRGSCPGLLDPMLTGDGLLARLPQAGPLTLAAFRAICRAAAAHGNGLLEVTARGSLQARGLSPASARAFADACGQAGIVETGGPAVVANPLGSLDPSAVADSADLVAKLRAAIARFAGRLAPKVAIVVDDGGRLHLDALSADIRLVAVSADRYRLGLAGDGSSARNFGVIAARDALPAVVALLEAIAATGRFARAADLHDAAAIVRPWLLPDAPAPIRPPAGFIGTHKLADGCVAVGVALAFGQAEAAILDRLAEEAGEAGATVIIPAPDRTILVLGLSPEKAAGFAEAAAALGFVTEEDDPRRRVVACAGAPACGAAFMPARAIAAEVALAARPLLAVGGVAHLSGCAKGCASRKPATLTLVGTEGGCAIIRNGRVGDAAAELVPHGEAIARIAELVGARVAEPA